jgi:hypothetical protein
MPRGEAPLMQYGADRRGRKKTRVPAFQNPKGPFRLLLRAHHAHASSRHLRHRVLRIRNARDGIVIDIRPSAAGLIPTTGRLKPPVRSA